MIASVRTMRTRKGRNPGQKMGLLTLEDATGRIESVVFSELFAVLESALVEDTIHFFKAKVDRRREEPALVISHLIRLDDAPAQLTRRVKIVLDASKPEAHRTLGADLEKLREALQLERRKVNGSGAEVWFEICLEEKVVHTNTGIKIPVHPGLEQRLIAMLSGAHRCELVGPGEPTKAPPPSRDFAQRGQSAVGF
jgi:DNA polymerase III alpha subunit